MKTILVMAVVVLTSATACAQKVKESELPAGVKEAFAKKYPGAKAEWEKEGADYEAEFDLNKVESSAVFDGAGTFKELEQEIKVAELPKGVADYCTKHFAGYKIEEAARITDAGGKVSYEAEMKKGKEHFDAMFDDKGSFLKKSEPSSKEEEKD